MMMFDGFVRVAAATPAIKVADCTWNSEQILHLVRQADQNQVSLVVFPELCLTGYTCSDLFLSDVLQQGSIRALQHIRQATAGLEPVCIVGLPLAVGSALYNVAAVLHRGRLLGLVPKQQIPNYAEFYEARHFSPAPMPGIGPATVRLWDEDIPFGTDLLFASSTLPDFVVGVEICEDLWVPRSPSIAKAQAGATVMVNLSASDETITKATYRRLLVRSHSARLICAYVYADAGEGESTTDLVFAGHNLLYENGRRLAESELFSTGLVFADADVRMLAQERRRQNTFPGEPGIVDMAYRRIPFTNRLVRLELSRDIPSLPFVPADRNDLAERCEEILSLQVHGLKKRLAHTGCRAAVVGLSGGLDSTLAFQVTVRAFDALGLDRTGIQAITMPGFGTTDRTYQNARSLAESQRVTLREIPISQAVLGHFADIGHDPTVQDVTYENAQARERTQILMDIANQAGGLVIGTGDLSELALGWATYNGDHMSMYGVNASVPKTLVRHLVRYAAGQSEPDLQRILLDIVDTPVSPELLPPQNGEIAQKTEQLVGPYELHDFFLYYLVRFGFEPGKILRLARHAFHEPYDGETIKRWLTVFLKRFFAQQFKRSCLPDGPKIGSVTLSPRGDWRMPSDASVALWLEELEKS
jgi:NAD+ synthase (glutamine-hydrolysing)